MGTLWVACKTLLDSRFIFLPSPAMNVGRNLFSVPLPELPRSKTLCLVVGTERWSPMAFPPGGEPHHKTNPTRGNHNNLANHLAPFGTSPKAHPSFLGSQSRTLHTSQFNLSCSPDLLGPPGTTGQRVLSHKHGD